MYYKIEDLGRYNDLYSADFAATTHSRAADKRVLAHVYDNTDPAKLIAVRYYYPSGKISTQYAYSNTVLQ